MQEKLTRRIKDVIVLAGVSGGGKLDFSPSRGQYGDFIDQELKRIHQNDISSLIDYINECLDVKSLILICDEGEPEYGEYNGSSSLGKKGISCRLTLNTLPIFPLPALLPALTCIWQAEFLLSTVQCWKSFRLVCSYCAKASLPFTKRYPRNLDAVINLTPRTRDIFSGDDLVTVHHLFGS
ncbi:unnamed protein product [Rhizophagus irregularis]|nr:unnamed protein product [Rhizophagus irregularis]